MIPLYVTVNLLVEYSFSISEKLSHSTMRNENIQIHWDILANKISKIVNMKEANYSINSENSSSFEEAVNEFSKPHSTMAGITPAKFENSFWVSYIFLIK